MPTSMASMEDKVGTGMHPCKIYDTARILKMYHLGNGSAQDLREWQSWKKNNHKQLDFKQANGLGLPIRILLKQSLLLGFQFLQTFLIS
jgi:hypothetical protein